MFWSAALSLAQAELEGVYLNTAWQAHGACNLTFSYLFKVCKTAWLGLPLLLLTYFIKLF